jgi:GT2 family glycosyltransferase
MIAILNWNGRSLLERFLPSVTKHCDGHTIAIIDNASTDDSCDFITKNYPQIEWIQLDQNYGYAGGYNKGLRHRSEDIAILLNSDVEVCEGWIQPIVELMAKDPDICAAQPKILDATNKARYEYAGACGGFLDRYAYPYCRGRIFESLEKDEGQYDEKLDIHWATGACLFFKLEEYHSLGGLDEDLFAHMEEIDLCWRARRIGKRVICVPESKVYHLGGGTLSGYRPFKSYLNFKNSLIIFLKNDRSGHTWSRLFIRMVLDLMSIVRFLTQFRAGHAFAVFKAHIHFYAALPDTMKKRKSLGKKHASLGKLSIVYSYFVAGRKKYSDLS